MIHSNWGTVAAEPCRRVPKAQVMSNRRPGCESRTAFPPFPRAERDERRGAGGGGVCGKGCGIAEAINRLTLLIPPRWLSGFPPNSRESLRGETHSQRKPDRLGEEERRPGWRRSAFRRRRHGRGKGSGAAGQSNVSHSCARCIRLHFPLGEVPPDATCAGNVERRRGRLHSARAAVTLRQRTKRGRGVGGKGCGTAGILHARPLAIPQLSVMATTSADVQPGLPAEAAGPALSKRPRREVKRRAARLRRSAFP